MSERLRHLLPLLPAYTLLLLGLFFHEPWRYELHAWLIALNTDYPWDLPYNMRYEGHPMLWQLLLWTVAQFSPDPWTLAWIHVFLAGGSLYLLQRYAPFAPWQKLLLSLSYFLVYEYGIIARCYAIGVLLLFGACILYAQRQRRIGSLALVLALLAHTNIYGWMLAFSLSGLLCLQTLIYERSVWQGRWGQWMAAAALVLLSLGSFFAYVGQPVDMFGTHSGLDLPHLRRVLSLPFVAYYPWVHWGEVGCWYGYSLPAKYPWLSFALGLSCLAAFGLAFAKRPLLLLFYGATTLGMLAFSYKVYVEGWRYSGHLWLVLLAAYWLREQVPGGRSWPWAERLGAGFFTVALAVQVAAGLYLHVVDWFYSFSNLRAAAQYAVGEQLPKDRILGYRGFLISPMTAWWRQPFYALDAQKMTTYLHWDGPSMQTCRDSVLVQRVMDYWQGQKADTLYLALGSPLPKELQWPGGHQAELLKAFDQANIAGESVYWYLIRVSK
jgi:hypothetical protein